MNDVNDKLSGLKTIVHKAEAYCAYQERCSHEVIQKLHEWKIDETRIPKIIETLINEKFINDLRFTQTFVESKFRLKKWGRKKIAYELRMKKIPDAIISEGLSCISDEDYQAAIEFLITQKTKEIHENDAFAKKQKLLRFLISRGYETDFALRVMKMLET